MMNRIFALVAALAFTLGTTGIASAGMQGQGTKPDSKKPEYAEKNPGDKSGKEGPAPTGAAEQRGGAAKEPAVRGEKAPK
jgi:hypothetical protein